MKQNVCIDKRAFTLIELLAVIVILAIIALIAVPIILNIIDDSKKQSEDRSAELYLKAAELAIARENLNGELGDTTCEVQDDGNLSCTTSDNNKIDVKVEMDGTRPVKGSTITFTNGKITSISSYKVGNTAYKLENGSLVASNGTDEEEKEETVSRTIYTTSSDIVLIGGPLEAQTKEVYCATVPQFGNSWDFGFVFNSQADCERWLSSEELDGTCASESRTIGLASGNYVESIEDIDGDIYIKHVVEHDIVQESYACIKYGANIEACFQGGNAYRGEDISNITASNSSNKTKLSADTNFDCYDDEEACMLKSTYLKLAFQLDGSAYSQNNDDNECTINDAGVSSCDL